MLRRVSLTIASATAWRCSKYASMNSLEFCSPTAVRVESRRHVPMSATAAGDPLKLLKDTITTAEEKVRRRQADVDAVTSYLAAPTKGKPQVPHHADDTTKVLWNMKNWTLQDLDRAKQDLRDAKQDLDRAEQRLRDANDHPTPVTTAMKNHITKYNTASLHHCRLDFSKRVGTETAGNSIYACFEKVLGAQVFTKQDTVATALQGASGVGKTFLALTYPSGDLRAQEYEAAGVKHVLIYAGFNYVSPLLSEEKTYMEKSITPKEAVGVVVLGRAVAGLLVALNNVDDLDRPPDDDLHRIADSLEALCLLRSDTTETYDALRAKAVELLLQLQNVYLKKNGEKLTVLINIDESQRLDKIVPSGGRYALRCLRQLQYDLKMKTSRTAVMGFATGINPRLWLETDTAGMNHAVDGRLTKKTDFYQIAEDVCRDKGIPWDSVHKVAAALMFPRVRIMIKRLQGEEYRRVTVASDMDTVKELLRAFIMNKTMPLSRIPGWCLHDNRYIQEAVPVFDGDVWRQVLGILNVQVDPSSIPTIDRVLSKKDNAAAYFESISFHTLSLLIALFYQPGTALCIDKEAADYFREHQGEALSKAIGIAADESVLTKISSFANYDYDVKKGNYLPFVGRGSLRSAIQRGVYNSFKYCVDRLTDGEAVFLYCGGDAPFDYIMARRVGKKLKFVYMDAKYKSDPKESLSTDAKKLMEDAVDVHKGLSSVSYGTMGDIKVEESYNVCIITNAELSNVMLKHINELDSNLTVLCPTTFNFSPLTDILYLTIH